MMTAVSGQERAQSAGASAAVNKKTPASYNMFLQLLTTQLKTQNPLNPTDATQFTQQLATFSSLEQQVSANAKLENIVNGLNGLSVSNGVAYIGKTVTANGNTFAVDGNGKSAATLSYALDGTAKSVKLTIVDARGNAVWTGSGDPSRGAHRLPWDGKDFRGRPLPAGDYTLKVSATDAGGNAVAATTPISGKVTGVDSSSGRAVLDLGGTKVLLSSVTRLTA